jgi:hypothetical protein
VASWTALIVHPTAPVGVVLISRAILARPRRWSILPPPATKSARAIDFRRLLRPLFVFTLSSSCPLARCHPHPAGKGSAVIRRAIDPNNRRVRWRSAISSQQWRARLIRRPPALTNRCDRLAAASCQLAAVVPAAARGFPGCTRSHSTSGASRWSESGGSSTRSSRRPACLP